jgi:hypothetical protein
MTTERNDGDGDGGGGGGGEIREQFQRLRRQDERLARPFSALRPARPERLEAGQRHQVRRRGDFRRRLAAAGLAAAALGLILAAGVGTLHWLRLRAAEPPAADAIVRLGDWRAPTDWLLRTPGDQLLRGVPRLGAPLLGGSGFTATTTNFSGGDERK